MFQSVWRLLRTGRGGAESRQCGVLWNLSVVFKLEQLKFSAGAKFSIALGKTIRRKRTQAPCTEAHTILCKCTFQLHLRAYAHTQGAAAASPLAKRTAQTYYIVFKHTHCNHVLKASTGAHARVQPICGSVHEHNSINTVPWLHWVCEKLATEFLYMSVNRFVDTLDRCVVPPSNA